MGAIGGLYGPSENGSDIKPKLQRLSTVLELIGPDGECIEQAGPLAMVHRPFHTSRASRQLHQPLVLADGSMLTWDGRLDNQDELEELLAGDLPAGANLLTLVHVAFTRWGVDALAYMVGEFTLAFWQADSKRLILACDAMGMRPLFYHVSPRGIVWASRAIAIVDALGLSIEIDEEYMADFLTIPNPAAGRSPFREIKALPGGHVLIFEGQEARLHRYWAPDPHKEIRYCTDTEYKEHFYHLFRQAVACRMQTEKPVFAELSGGLDSSSIVCVGDQILADGDASAPDLRTVSYVFDRAREADERPFIQVVEEQRGRQGLHLLDDEYPILSPVPPDLRTDFPTNQLCFLSRHDALAAAMKKSGSRVLLRGEAGDQLLSEQGLAPPTSLADDLVQGRPLQCLRECLSWSRAFGAPLPKTLWQGVIFPLLPRALKARTEFISPLGGWLDPNFVRRLRLRERQVGPVDDVGFRLPSLSHLYSNITSSTRVFALEMTLSQGYIEARYPFLDRRLVEFVLAIPAKQKNRTSQSRLIMRRALHGVLPEAIRRRRSKGGPSSAFCLALQRERSRLLESFKPNGPLLASYGVIDGDEFLVTLDQAVHGIVRNIAQLLRTLSLELWLQSLHRRDFVGSSGAH